MGNPLLMIWGLYKGAPRNAPKKEAKIAHFGFFFKFFLNKGVFLVKMKNAYEPVKCDNSGNTYSRISTVPRGSEQSK